MMMQVAASLWRRAIVWFWLVAVLYPNGRVIAAETIPPKPTRYFNDYAGIVSPATAQQLNQRLEDFERASSSQIVVAIFPNFPSNSSVADYTVRVAQAWGAGQKGKNNGAVLFVFVREHQIYLQVGYGLEGAIPDAISKTIIEQEIKPRFRAGNYDAGFIAGVNAILQAARGEYHGTGRTVAERRGWGPAIPVLIFVVFFLIALAANRRSQGTVYRRSGRSDWGTWTGGWGGGSWGGGSWGGGGGGSSAGGGFSSGGGSFGGGGAGGQW
jgi:uncharacterized protein